MTRLSWAAGAFMLGCALASGCSPSSDADAGSETDDEAAAIVEDAKTLKSPQQAEALADGHVSVEEMEAALAAFESCLESTHWHLEHVYPDPIAGEPHFTYQMVPDQPDRDSGDRHACELETFRFVDVYAQTIQEPSPMDPAVRARTMTCLEDSDVPSESEDTTAREIFLTAGQAHANDVVDCMLGAHQAEFPDREEIAVGIPPEVDGF